MRSSAAFWDASALVPLVVRQPTSDRALQLSSEYTQFVWWATIVEIYSALSRELRMGHIAEAEWPQALERIGVLKSRWREIHPDHDLRDQATSLLTRHPLRAADSLQLAAALSWCKLKPVDHAFVCADVRLAEAAAAVGFEVIALR